MLTFNTSKTKSPHENVSFWITWRHLEHCDNSTERTFRKLFPVMYPGMLERYGMKAFNIGIYIEDVGVHIVCL